MHLKPPNDMRVVKWQDKEERLTAFIAEDIRERLASDCTEPTTYLVIARSLESPVVRALASLAGEFAQAKVSVKMVMSAIDLYPHSELIELEDSAALASTTRLAQDHRLFDAHEQLVISSERVWIGDVLRREPSKRDAYEYFCSNCSVSARNAMLAFRRIWATATPIAPININSLAFPMGDGPNASLILGVEASEQAQPSVGTRH